jgi:rhamnulose-1-phosphate aldolase
VEVRNTFPIAPELAGATVIVSRSGRRLRELGDDPTAGVGAIAIGADGISAVLHTSSARHFAKVPTEPNSHLAVHADQVARTGTISTPSSMPSRCD